MLQQHRVVSYLLSLGLDISQQAVEGGLSVLDASNRNTNYKIVTKHGPSYLLKQGVGADKIATIEREAAIYKLLGASVSKGEASSDFSRYLPHFYNYDQDEHILLLELLAGAPNLLERHQRLGRFPLALGTEMGYALGALHSAYSVEEVESVLGATSRLPGALSVHRPHLRDFPQISNANIQLIKIIQRFPRFGELLDELRREWRLQSGALVHGDIKWSNVLAVDSSNQERKRKAGIKIVDWELAGVGDPCWDVGSVFGDYLSFWLQSIPITGGEAPDRFLELALYPLAKMQPAMRAFWQAYVRRMGLGDAAAHEWLSRSVRYTAARLVQTAYEQGQTSALLTGNAICFLQLSLNILERPGEAAIHLLGIQPP